MSFFKPRVSFHLSFASNFSVMTHSSSEIFWLKHYASDKKSPSNCNFSDFECFNESSPNSSCQFWNHKVKVYSNFASLLSVTKDNSSVFFYLKPLYFGQKEPIKVKFSDFWVFGWKFTKFLMSYLKLQVSFSLNFASLFSFTRDNSSVLF